MGKFGSIAAVGTGTPFDPTARLVTSPFLPTIVLALLRLLFGAYMFGALLALLIHRAVTTHDTERFFTYFTQLTGIGLCAYLLHSGWLTFAYAMSLRRHSGVPEKASYPLQHWPRFLQILHNVLLASVRTLPFLVTIVFWTFLADSTSLGTPFLRYDNVSVHALNSVFAIFEILCTNTPMAAWFNIVYMIIILGAYVGEAYVTHASLGYYTYDFLDPKYGAGHLAAYIVGIPVGEAIVFSIVNLVIWLRIKLSPKPTISTTTTHHENGDEKALKHEV